MREVRVENFSQGVLEILGMLGKLGKLGILEVLGKLEILGWVILNSQLSTLKTQFSLNWIRFFSNFSLRPLSTAHRQRQG